jgi:hypothetical protein
MCDEEHITLSEAAVHEAGHAVVAAYLRVPFTHVTIKPGRDHDGYIRVGAWTTKAASRATRQIINSAVVVLAARAAIEMPEIQWNGQISEDSYAGDDEDFRQCGMAIKIADEDMQEWRHTLILLARELVAIADIKIAIMLVAANLDRQYALTRTGLPSKHVRHLLQWAKDNNRSATAQQEAATVKRKLRLLRKRLRQNFS